MNSIKTDISYILGGALLILTIGLYNGYPFVYSDTGIYLWSGFDGFVPIDRPIFYGLFLRHISMKFSLWFAIIVQDILLSYVLYEVYKLVMKERSKVYFILSLFCLTYTTAMPWYSNQLMPDIFVGILGISLFLLLFLNKMSGLKATILSLLVLFSASIHFSHLLIGTTLITILFVVKILVKKPIEVSMKRITLILGLVCSVWLIIPSVNFLYGSSFTLSKGSHVFLMAHLNEKGVLKRYLDDHCNKHPELKLCDIKEDLPNNVASFIWSKELSGEYGGFEGSKEEFDFIINDILYDPAYLWDNIYKSLVYGLIQLTYNNVGEGFSPNHTGSPAYVSINKHLSREVNDLLNSKQNRWKGLELNFQLNTRIQLLLILASLFVLVFILSSGRLHLIDRNSKNLLFFAIAFIVLNSIITAGLSAPYARYSSRIIWLFPMAISILCMNNWPQIRYGKSAEL